MNKNVIFITLVVYFFQCTVGYYSADATEDKVKNEEIIKTSDLENEAVEKKEIAQKKQSEQSDKTSDNIFKVFVRKFITVKENQIFGKNKYGVFATYGLSINRDRKGILEDVTDVAGRIYEGDTYFIEYDTDTKMYYKYKWNGDYRYRAIGNASIHYSVPDRLMHINGRLSLGFFSWHGLNHEYDKRFGVIGVEFIQEWIFGSPMLYFTAGVGPVYAIPISHYNKHTNMASQFFFAIVANIGHRFDNGVVIELGVKHYSNGETQPPNYGLNIANMTIGYTF